MAEVSISGNWTVNAGWRVTTTPILGQRYWHHKPFVGVSAPLPSLFWGHVRTRFGAELVISAFKHVDSTVDLGLFLRAELARGF
jgi:hypothetical protein